MSANQSGREPFIVLELVQQKCENTYGVAPCTANESIKCFNTNVTCQDPANYQGSANITWRFIKPDSQNGQYLLDGQDPNDTKTYGIPCLKTTTTTPTKLNVGGALRNSSAFGTRATLTAVFDDIPYDDQFADDYIISRTYNPINQGTFWGKYLARNPYYQNSKVRLYEGYHGQTLDQMNVREYLIDSINLSANGNVTLKAHDPLRLTDNERAEFPPASQLQLNTAINNSQTTGIEVFGSESDLSDIVGITLDKWITVNDEIIKYDGFNDLGNSTYELLNVSRGAFNTAPSPADANDKCQRIGRYLNAEIPFVILDLIRRSPIGDVYSNAETDLWFDQWDEEYSNYQAGFLFTGTVTTPTPIGKVLANLAAQGNFYLWWDEREKAVKYKVNRPERGAVALLDDRNNIMEDTVNIIEKPQDRKSRAVIYYNFDENKLLDGQEKTENYKNVHIRVDADSESESQYGESRTQTFLANFVTQDQWAQVLGEVFVSKYRDNPRFATLKLDAKDGQYWTGDVVDITTRSEQNFDGSEKISRWQIVSATEAVSSEIMEYVLQSFQFFGRFGYWTDDDYPTYTDATQEQKDNGFFWSDNDGKMSDGTDGYKWQV